jgi:Type I restriction enzyme R protein N terminus (HSDR_N)
MNEEEVKARIVIPYLLARGLSEQELHFEKSFTVRIGKNTVLIDGSRGKASQRARLDILVRRRGVNLLVVEVKAPSHTLSDNDRDQAISYARLLHPIAPFALVSNGTDFQLFDVLTKERLTSENTHFPDGGTLALPDEARLEALRLFFDVSPDNLGLFARAQAERVIEPLLGPPGDYAAVYIPETHVEREELTAAAKAFLSDVRPLFLLAGESGMGKSCVMIDLARGLANDGHPVLFFRGALIKGNILDEIAEEVEWAFGSQRGAIDALRRLAKNSGGKSLIVMIDGVEDWPFQAKVQNLASLAAHATAENVRLIVSCKTTSWEPFAYARGTRTGIESSIHGASAQRQFSAQAGPFSPREFFRAVDLHCKAYGIESGGFDPAAMREAMSSPFMLRLMFQVRAAESRTVEAPSLAGDSGRIAFDSSGFFEKYLRLVAQRTGQEEIAINALIGIAKILYETNQEWVEEQPLRAAWGLRVTEQVPTALFEQRLLISADAPGLRRIGFSFGLLRNYIIAFYVRHWPPMSPDEFAREFVHCNPSSLRAELLSFYYPFASDTQKRVVDAPVRKHALDYLRNYVALIEEFPALRDSFMPLTRARIGFAGELIFPACIGMYGFRPIGEHDEEILLIPVAGDERSVRLFVAGVEQAHYLGFVDGFRKGVSVNQIRASEITNQLEKMVAKGRLNETGAPELAEELITCILISHAFFAAFVDKKTKAVRFPIDIADIATALKREFLYRHFRSEAVEAKRQRGEIKETWNGTRVSYSANLRPAEEEQVFARVEAAIQSGDDVKLRAHYVDLEPLKSRLEKVIEACGVPRLAGPVLPLREELVAGWIRGEELPLDKVKEHCREVLEIALRGYRAMIQTNFPNLAQHFRRYQRGPLRAVLALDSGFATDHGRSFLALCESRSMDSEVVVCDEGQARLDLASDTVTTPDGTHKYLEARWPSIGEFLHGRHRGSMEYDCDGAVLRRLIYGWIEDDFREAKRALERADDDVS